MKNIRFLLLLFVLSGMPSLALSQGYAVFPQERVTDLVLISCDPETSSFTIQNNIGEQVTGYLGDFVGVQEGEVVNITDSYVTLETIFFVECEDGKQLEQRSRMRIPLTFGLEGRGKGID